MNSADLVSQYEGQSDDQLARIVAGDYDLTQAILSMHPQIAQDAGFELFDANWTKRYWRNIVAEISGNNATDSLYSWAMGVSIASAANLIVQHYQLPAAALASAVALAVILLRAAKASKEEEGKT